MKKIIFTLFSFCSLLFSAGTYDTYAFTDEEEKYSLHFVNTALSTDMTGIGLTATDSTAICRFHSKFPAVSQTCFHFFNGESGCKIVA